MHTINFVDLIQGSAEWKEFRKMKLGSSMAASIQGVGFRTPLQLFEDILEEREIESNEAMRRGVEVEPKARAWLNEKYKAELQPAVVRHRDPLYDWHISSLDGIWQRPDGTWFVCEIKHSGKDDHQTALDGQVPEKYLPQCLHILEDLPVVESILYLSYRENSQAQVWVNREDYKEEMKVQFEKEKEFYQRLLNCRPPEPTSRDWIEFTNSQIVSKADTYSSIMDQINSLQEKASAIKEELIEDVGTANRARIGNLKIQKVIRQGSVDYSKVEALKGIDLNPYRKEPVVSWRVC